MAGEQIEAKAVEIINKLMEVAPTAAQIGLETFRVQALSWLFAGLAYFSASALLVWGLGHIGRPLIADLKSGGQWDDGEFAWGALRIVACAILAFALAICAGHALYNLASAWTWVGIFRPEVLIAKKVLGL